MDNLKIVLNWASICTSSVPVEAGCDTCPYREKHDGFRTCIEGLLFDALALLKEDCHNCKLECILQKYDELKEKYDAMLKEQEAVKPVRDKLTGRIWLCGNCGTYVGFEDNDPHDPNEFDKHCRECGRPVLWEGR